MKTFTGLFFYKDGWTALHFATMNGYADIAIVILKKRANANCLDKVSLKLIIGIYIYIIQNNSSFFDKTYFSNSLVILHYTMLVIKVI